MEVSKVETIKGNFSIIYLFSILLFVHVFTMLCDLLLLNNSVAVCWLLQNMISVTIPLTGKDV